jgi:NAD(P)-dependent dehydrogenase (short-subunit alcohol dehydrogenase family)
MTEILITGGQGDWATSFQTDFGHEYSITTAGRQELDVTDPQSVAHFFEGKSFDVVINNAGCIHPKRILDAEIDAWINDINVNLIGTFLVSKQALHANPKTTIINISSTAGFNAYADWSAYCASKAAVITFTKCLANDNYQAYCLCPGAINTKFRDQLNLSNASAMDCQHMSKYVVDILHKQFSPGDVLFFRKDEFVLNP